MPLDDLGTRRADRSFVDAAMALPLLSREHEYRLATRWREAGDTAALHELVRAYGRLVIAATARFRHYGLPAGDLVQEGNVGLLQAAARFEPARGVRFSTYAAWWIRSALQDYVLRNWSIVRTGTTAAQKTLFFGLRRLRARIEAAGRGFDDEGRRRIAAALAVELAEVESMEQRLAGGDQTLNLALGLDDGAERQDLIADARPSPEDVVIGRRDGATRARWLAEALAELPPRERRIIHERRLRDESATLETLGLALGISKERVRQLEQRALGKLRAGLCRRGAVAEDMLGAA